MHSPQEQVPDHFKQEPIHTAPRVGTALVGKALAQPSTESSKPSQPETLATRLLDQFWIRMTEMYGHRWISNYGDTPKPDSVWGKVLAGLTGAQLAIGLGALVDRGEEFDWPPPANAFRALCLQVPGLPTEGEAWDQALRGEYQHEAVRIAAKATGTYDLKGAKLNDKGLRARFNRNYAIVRARAVMGKPLDGHIPEAIGHEVKTPMQVQFAHSHQQARDLIMAQNLPMDAKQARQLLLAKMGIRREARHA